MLRPPTPEQQATATFPIAHCSFANPATVATLHAPSLSFGAINSNQRLTSLWVVIFLLCQSPSALLDTFA